MRMRVTVGLVVLGLALGLSARANDSTRVRPSLVVGAAVTLNAYSGDLTASRGLQSPGAGVQLMLQFDEPRQGRRQRRVRPQLVAGFGSFQADDLFLPPVNGQQANRFVQTRFWYVNLNVLVRPLPRPVALGAASLRPHVSVGAGLLNFTPRDGAGAPLLDQVGTRAQGETYSTGTLSLPLGLGAQLRWGDWGLSLDYQYVVTGSAYLDNIDQLGRSTGSDALHRLSIGVLLALGR